MTLENPTNLPPETTPGIPPSSLEGELPVGQLIELANEKAARLKQIYETPPQVRNTMTPEAQQAINAEKDEILGWFDGQLGEGEKLSDRATKVDAYMRIEGIGGGKELADFFNNNILIPLVDIRQSREQGNDKTAAEQPLSDEKLAKLAYDQIIKLKRIDSRGKTGELSGKPISTLEELSKEERQILSWFSANLGQDNGEEKKLTQQVSLIEEYVSQKPEGEALRDFFYSHVVTPLRDPDTSREPTPIPWEATRALALEKLKQMAERGVVVQKVGERRDPKTKKLIGEYSDLDGNMALHLLERANIIGDDTPVHHVGHDDVYKFLEENDRIGIVIDISEESKNPALIESGQPHRDSLISRISRHDTGEKITNYGRIYFEHHGEGSNPNSGCGTSKVYEWLVTIGALPRPELTEAELDKLAPADYIKAIENNEGVRLKHLVDFVDAQDNKNYYPGPDSPNQFDIEQTVTNAFGLMQARTTDKDGNIRDTDWWGRYEPGQGYNEPFRRLMMLTGKKHDRQFTMEQLRDVIGINKPEVVVKRLRNDIAKCRAVIKDLRQSGFIQPTEGGSEIFIDERKTVNGRPIIGQLERRGVDPTDMLMSEGIRSRMIMGLDETGRVQTITAFAYHDAGMMEKFRQWQKTKGGQIARNSIYIYKADKKTSE